MGNNASFPNTYLCAMFNTPPLKKNQTNPQKVIVISGKRFPDWGERYLWIKMLPLVGTTKSVARTVCLKSCSQLLTVSGPDTWF